MHVRICDLIRKAGLVRGTRISGRRKEGGRHTSNPETTSSTVANNGLGLPFHDPADANGNGSMNKPRYNRERTASSSSLMSSSHPDSPSHQSTVRFDDNQSQNTPSIHSTRPPQNGHSYQPTHPSILHNSTVPPAPKTAPLLSSSSRSNPGLKQLPTTPPLNGAAGPSRPSISRNQSSRDRGRWSELPPTSRTHRSGSLLTHGKRASRVTGGYESSSDEEGSNDGSTKRRDEEGTPGTDTYSFSGAARSPLLENRAAVAGPSRPRAKSLMLPLEGQSSDRSSGSLQTRRRRGESQTLQIRTSKDLLRQAPSRMASQKSIRNSSNPAAHLSTSRSDSFFTTTHGPAAPSRMPSTRSHAMETAVTGPSRSASARIKDLDRANGRRDRTSSPEASRKGKAKEKDSTKRTDNLAASLGLGIGGIKEMALSPDQIHDLLNDSDLAYALRIMNNNQLSTPRPPLFLDDSPYFSPPNTRPTSPSPEATPHFSPYLVSAPPALTGSEAHGRQRTVSMSSSIGPPMQSTWGASPRHRSSFDTSSEAYAHGRARAASRVSMSPNDFGGHVPFTHHVPIAQVEEEVSDNATQSLPDEAPSTPASETEPVIAKPAETLQTKKGVKEKKGRLSQLFHLGKRKGAETVISEPQPKDGYMEHRAETQKSEEYAKAKAQLEREAEMRRLEQERRADELAQERRFKALTQVAAHPAAERMAYRAGSHLRAYYQHVYDGIDNPPRLNPLAILRWRTKTDDQNEARRRWEAQHDRADVSSTRSEQSMPQHSSPQAKGSHWGGMIHSSPMSVESSSGFKDRRKSVESNPSFSRASTQKSHELSPRKKKAGLDGFRSNRGWEYSVDDIASYKACNGVVNYFIPPRKEPLDIEVMAKVGDVQHGSRAGQTRRDDGSSMAGSRSSKKGMQESRMRVQTASNLSLLDAERSGLNGDESVAPLSRTTSVETGGKSISGTWDQRLRHRSHQSLSAMGQTSLTHALKQPFEKLSNAAKKQRTMPHLDGNDRDAESAADDSLVRNDVISTPSHQMANSYPMTNKTSRTTIGSHHSRQQFFRRHDGHGPESVTDDEGGRDFHLKRLFLKGQRAFAAEEARSVKRSDTDLARHKGDEREAELFALESALAREAAFRESQAEATRKTQLEVEARERITRLENEIYEDRVERFGIARRKLDRVTSNIEVVDESIQLYVAQLDFLGDEAKIGADVEIDLSAVDPLRVRYASRRKSIVDAGPDLAGERRDTLPPLRHFSIHDSGSDRSFRRPIARIASNAARRTRSQSQSQSPAAANRRRMSVSDLQPPLDPQFSLHMRHRPRRTYLDLNGTSRVDPMKQAELIIAYAKGRQQDMVKERVKMGKELEKMILGIEGMIKQKEAVRHWARDALEKNTARREYLDQLLRQERSSMSVNLAEWRDPLLNHTVKTLALGVRSAFWVYYQAKAELGLYLAPFKPSTYCNRRRKSTKAKNQNMNGTPDGKIEEESSEEGDQVADGDLAENYVPRDFLVELQDSSMGRIKTKSQSQAIAAARPTWGERKRRIPVLGLVSLGVLGIAIYALYNGGLQSGPIVV
ncbi:hypothetical protein IAR55_004974 [Kwoniella newhampshirensis]|uniref:Uncharacterized protein n=1 Tax=Kwoniella newhampshirensis TaxID=1651941 RepID=A0AAW0YX48_9TREE